MKAENKKTAKAKKAAEKKKQAVKDNVRLGLLIGIPVLIFCFILLSTFVDFKAVFNGTANTANFFSKNLTEDGKIADGKASDYVKVSDYQNFSINYADIEATDEAVVSRIKNNLSGKLELKTTKDIVAEDGDTVNIDYIGMTADGDIFEDTKGFGTDLTLGSGSYIPGFEEQVVGHHVKEEFDVNVTFPDVYENNPDLAGVETVFKVTLNGVYDDAELTDEVVMENFSEVAETAEEYRAYVQDEIERENIENYIDKFIRNDGEILKYPEGYLEHMNKVTDYLFESQFDFYNDNYSAYGSYKNKYDYYNQTKEEYNATVKERAESDASFYLKCEAIAEQLGITITDEEIVEFWKEQGTDATIEELLEIYGRPYATRVAICGKVEDYLAENTVTVK